MSPALEKVIARQDELIGALDARDAAAIEAASLELADALRTLGAEGAVYGVEARRVEHALRQCQAARIRVNVLSDWTRQRIDRLTEVRSGSSLTYSNKVISAPVA
jgi:hypothetical protein